VEEVCKGNPKEGCEDDSKPDDDGSGSDGDNKTGWLGVELGEVGQRTRDRPKAPQGSIGAEDDGAGAGDDKLSVCEGEVSAGWDAVAGWVTGDCTFVELAGADGWGPIQRPSTMAEGDKQTTGEGDGEDEGVGVFDCGGGCEDEEGGC